mgnify:CR=1 FL=1
MVGPMWNLIGAHWGGGLPFYASMPDVRRLFEGNVHVDLAVRIRDLTARDHVVEPQAGDIPFAVAQPADARGQPLERDPIARHADPAGEVRVVREQLEHPQVQREVADVFFLSTDHNPQPHKRTDVEVARSIGRGGTNIAHSDNGSVLHDNPAGISNMCRPRSRGTSISGSRAGWPSGC